MKINLKIICNKRLHDLEVNPYNVPIYFRHTVLLLLETYSALHVEHKNLVFVGVRDPIKNVPLSM